MAEREDDYDSDAHGEFTVEQGLMEDEKLTKIRKENKSRNLSSNSLEGTLPSGLCHKSLATLDLSNNQFTGSIPDSLTSSNLQLMLLNGNSLEGLVPGQLYSIGVHGGEIESTDDRAH